MLCTKQLLSVPIKLEELTQFMLYDLTNTNALPCSQNNVGSVEYAESAKTAENSKYNKKYQMSIIPNIPLSRVEINYSKKYSKYNEPFKITNHKNFQDKLFWLFYKIINNFVDSDLESLNSFTIMKDFKFGVVEKLRSQKNILKNYKISKSFVEDDLTNNTYSVLCTNNDEKIYNLQNYKILALSNEKMSAQFNNFDVELLNGSLSEEQLQSYLSTYFYIENIEKPLKAFSSYKLDELIKIAEQLKITIYDENGKKRKKQDYYEKIIQKVT